MDDALTKALIGFFMTATSACAALAAYLKSRSEVKSVMKDRETTKQQRDTESALLNTKLEMMQKQFEDYKATTEKRLEAGDLIMKGFTEQFSMLNSNVAYIRGVMESREKYEHVMKDTNKNVVELISLLKSSTRNSGHSGAGM